MEVSVDFLRKVSDVYIDDDGNELYAFVSPGEGWWLLWADGETLHTYRNPEDWLNGPIDRG